MAGYSLELLERNKQADIRNLGVRLGRVCIKNNVSVIDVANALGVTRQTIYNWFSGVATPTVLLRGPIVKFIAKYSN